LELLTSPSWPGNVRSPRTAALEAVAIGSAQVITVEQVR
jgi:DNA-binding NtrC family response regulator